MFCSRQDPSKKGQEVISINKAVTFCGGRPQLQRREVMSCSAKAIFELSLPVCAEGELIETIETDVCAASDKFTAGWANLQSAGAALFCIRAVSKIENHAWKSAAWLLVLPTPLLPCDHAPPRDQHGLQECEPPQAGPADHCQSLSLSSRWRLESEILRPGSSLCACLLCVCSAVPQCGLQCPERAASDRQMVHLELRGSGNWCPHQTASWFDLGHCSWLVEKKKILWND